MKKPALIIDLKFEPNSVRDALPGAFGDREIINLADPDSRDRDLSAAGYALVWQPEADLFSRANL